MLAKHWPAGYCNAPKPKCVAAPQRVSTPLPHKSIKHLFGLFLNCSNISCRNSWCYTGLVSTCLLSCGTVKNVGHNNTLVLSHSHNDLPACSITDIYLVNNVRFGNAASRSLCMPRQRALLSSLSIRNTLSCGHFQTRDHFNMDK